MTSILPVLIIFDFECTLLPFNHSHEVVLPFTKIKGNVMDKLGYVIQYTPEMPAIFEKLKNASIKIAITSHSQPEEDNELINLFGWDKYISFKEIAPGLQTIHFKNIRKKSKIPFDKMIFFDNWQYHVTLALRLGIFAVYVDPDYGMSMDILENALNEYELLRKE